MSKNIATALLVLLWFLPAHAHARQGFEPAVPLDAIQGAWWSDCHDQAAAFVVDGDEYFGDFQGRYKLALAGDAMVFEQGLVDGHSVNVTHRPVRFRVIVADPGWLVLRPIPRSPDSVDWRLKSCSSMPSDHLLKPKPLRGRA